MKPLRIAVATYGHTKPLKDGSVVPKGVALQFVEVNPMVAAYRRMVRERAYDVCEVAVTTYLVAKAHGKGFTALPIVLNHMLHHGDVQVGLDTGIETPQDLRGKRVGVRAYTVTTGVWVRGLLQSEYGVDPSTITWITDDEEHVQEFRAPANVIAAPEGKSLVELFHSGAIDAAFAGPAGLGRSGPPREGWDRAAAAAAPAQTRPFKPLFADAERLDAEWYRRTGVYPMHGVLCVKDEILAEDPSVARALVDAFTEAKAAFLRRLDAEGPQSDDDRRWTRYRAIVGPDPLPFGIEENRKTIDMLIRYAFEQGLIPKRYAAEEVFVAP